MGSMHDYIYEGYYDDKKEGCLPPIIGMIITFGIGFAGIMINIKSGMAENKYGMIFLVIVIISAMARGVVTRTALADIKKKKEMEKKE